MNLGKIRGKLPLLHNCCFEYSLNLLFLLFGLLSPSSRVSPKCSKQGGVLTQCRLLPRIAKVYLQKKSLLSCFDDFNFFNVKREHVYK